MLKTTNFNLIIFIIFLTYNINSLNIKDNHIKYFTLCGTTMGTSWKIIISDNHIKKKLKFIKKNVQHILNKCEKKISSWNVSSFVSTFDKYKINQPKLIDKDIEKILSISINIGKKTHNALDITIGKLINIWGFGTTIQPIHYPSKKIIQETKLNTGLNNIQLIKNTFGTYVQKKNNAIKINLSTIGEGYAADQVRHFLKNVTQNYIISIGGVVIGNNTNKKKYIDVNILLPIKNKNIIHRTIHLTKDKAISTSGVYRNYYYLHNKYISHLINPITGKPINNNLLSVSVISNSALIADTWDTALMILGFQEAKKISILEKLPVYIIRKEKKNIIIWYSPQFKQFL
ncbi:MAG: FAD:protein FMN transferase [Buchnera aphidicola (Eriosoma harunire)]